MLVNRARSTTDDSELDSKYENIKQQVTLMPNDLNTESTETMIVMQFSPTIEESSWLDNCIVCYPSIILDIAKMGEILAQQGYFGGSAVRLGGEVLLKLSFNEEQMRMLSDQATAILLCVHSLRTWKYFEGKLMRPVWVKVRGAPLHLWSSRFFAEVCSNVGSVIKVDGQTIEKTEMQFGRVLVLTSSKLLIHSVVKIETDWESFTVKIDEELVVHRSVGGFAGGNNSEWPVLRRQIAPNRRHTGGMWKERSKIDSENHGKHAEGVEVKVDEQIGIQTSDAWVAKNSDVTKKISVQECNQGDQKIHAEADKTVVMTSMRSQALEG